MKITVSTFAKRKAEKERISMLTCYDYTTAKIVNSSNVDAVLVGDSLGNVMLGYEDTLSVTMEDMITFGHAVARGCKDKLVVIDMPFMSYQVSVEQAVTNAGRLLKEGRGNAVKLEGGKKVAEHIRAITNAGIPVMAHIGMTPQSVNAFGGNKVQGKSELAAKMLIEDALAVQEAGAFSVVLECVPAKLAKIVTEKLSIPTIGIGAGPDCDGQILVYQDMLGMYKDFSPKFVKHFGNVGDQILEAFNKYDSEVKTSAFPSEEHCFKIDEEVLEKLY
ncbi:3-methyl-2-oxobutanoate hydroxymethyltransferase [Succinivibrio dextrinosolvens]|jgi:3-methyl-2-oxobutanoate hydroxymethyltransferase|uniref:3-methyl-2-oxobutanoate hydroxymethyltransferase n=1 Tax=Succinivibrio dextrinosolvens TaxID=83771 RepID=UPI0004E1AFC5|nr:3-methyl-2-oxobutanoate hydroxymethyltransferase [Succinivibrio dextrinosolvens]MBE6421853.1 3-methyl-2-oxobutanoate hydroxymethyltransferase [Succinivibrio dextrinosolvens]MBQ3678318.1 3-methyl-2-oxobutanoate hydroxymethyltransferase [Succinivibrio sp.]